MRDMTIIVLSTCLFSLSIAYLIIVHNFNKLREYSEKLFLDFLLVQHQISDIEDKNFETEDSVHKENFIKFLSDSRDWAYQYIEEVQLGINNFISEVEPEINYFREYGDIASMSPNYYSMKKISDEYDKLKTLLPLEEESK
jgi:hypothetical protein